jgi:hypothetical protein
MTLGWNDRKGDVNYFVKANLAYNQNKVSKYKGVLKEGWVTVKTEKKYIRPIWEMCQRVLKPAY